MIGPEFDHFCALVGVRSGLVLGRDKAYLVASRLEPVARAQGLGDVPALLARLKNGAPESLIAVCVDAMATHESLFFRDGAPFEQVENLVLPALADARPAGQPLRILSAACSSGQEPYSLAMLCQENAHRLAGRRVEIVGTDMAETILAKARAGLYSSFEVQRGLSPERAARWMTPRGAGFEISQTLKSMVSFRRHNLLDGMAAMGVFDIVFCRNVLIYFDQAKKAQVLNQLANALAPDGALFLGSAETVMGLTDALVLQPGSRGLYRRRDGAAAKAARIA
jgi:chemotaxis protein methyltransferase CheR